MINAKIDIHGVLISQAKTAFAKNLLKQVDAAQAPAEKRYSVEADINGVEGNETVFVGTGIDRWQHVFVQSGADLFDAGIVTFPDDTPTRPGMTAKERALEIYEAMKSEIDEALFTDVVPPQINEYCDRQVIFDRSPWDGIKLAAVFPFESKAPSYSEFYLELSGGGRGGPREPRYFGPIPLGGKFPSR